MKDTPIIVYEMLVYVR